MGQAMITDGAPAKDNAAPRERLVLFRWPRPGLSHFLVDHLREQVETLSIFFDVAVIDRDCDYGEVCEELQPALCIFESGVYAGPRRITNTQLHPEVPKLGFLHADAFDSSRAAFIADMSEWGVEWFFTTSMAMAEYTPDLGGRLFVWPNSVDTAVFRDYGLVKNIPVLLTGSQASHYPWRNAVSQVVSESFTTMTMPHFGWNAERGTSGMMKGEAYARLLNASTFVPTCGTMARDVVRKHLEIPAAGACLVTEDTPAIRAFGFVDMVNCVFADAGNVATKLDGLLAEPARLQRITAAGHDLVHGRHGQQSRDQVLQWLELVRRHGPGMRLEQQWPEGRLQLAQGPESGPPSGGAGRDRKLIADGWRELVAGRAGQADGLFLRALNYYFIPEAAVGMVFSRLTQGDADGAGDWITRTLTAVFNHHLSPAPDPVQWACEVRVMLCRGDLAAAVAASLRFPDVGHPELERMRRVVWDLGSIAAADRPPTARTRASVHRLPEQSEHEWSSRLVAMLAACGHQDLADAVGRGWQEATPGPRQARSGNDKVDTLLARLHSGGGTRSRPEKWLRSRLSPIKGKVMTDPWSARIGKMLVTEPLSHAAMIEPGRFDRTAMAIRSALGANPDRPPVSTVQAARKRGAGDSGELSQADIDQALGSAPDSSRTLIYLTSRGCARIGGTDVLDQAALLVIEGTATPAGYRIMDDLLSGNHVLVMHEPDRGRGWAVLRRSTAGAQRTGGGHGHV